MKKRRISNSEIQTYKDCPRKWWLAHYRELRKKRSVDAPSRPLQVGTLVHAALDFYYDPSNYPHVSDQAVMEHLMGLIQEEISLYSENEEFAKDAETNGDYALTMVEGYLDWLAEEGADSTFEIIAPEQNVETRFTGTEFDYPKPVVLSGKLDTRVRNLRTGAKQFFETKTVASLEDFAKGVHMNEQIYMYHLLEYLHTLEHETEIERTDGAIINLIKRSKRTSRAKPPFYKRIEVHHNIEELRSFYLRTWGVVRTILAAEVRLMENEDPRVTVPPTPSRDCFWKCEFLHVCPLFDSDREAAEQRLIDEFEHYDPYERYGVTEEVED